jgi:hypothetical protein
MNANELADLLEVDSWYKLVSREEIATMLRKQAEEIEYWKEKFNKAMVLTEHVKYLESQVYGGSTK